MPERSASSAASASAAVVVPTISWLHALASDPDPSGPSRRTVLPIAPKSGRSRRKSLSLAPAMMARVPSAAPLVPPLTGASTTTALPPLASATRAPKSRTPDGDTLLMTTTAVPGVGGLAAQPARSAALASSMSDRSGSMKTMTGWSPSASKASSAAGERFQAVTVHPAARRLAAIGAPIRPRPTNPASLRSISMRCPHFVVVNLEILFSILASIQYDEHYDDQNHCRDRRPARSRAGGPHPRRRSVRDRPLRPRALAAGTFSRRPCGRPGFPPDAGAGRALLGHAQQGPGPVRAPQRKPGRPRPDRRQQSPA